MTMTSAQAAGGTKAGTILSGATHDVYSREILFNAQPVLRTFQFADRKTELGRERGDTIKFTRYNDLTGSAKLSEVENIATTHLSASQVSISVDEYGHAVAESERLIRTSWDDVVARATMLLGQHYGRTTESMVQDEFRAAGSLQTISAAARASLAAGNTLGVTQIKDANELLAINKAPKIGGAYVCLVHPHCARGLRSDSAWLDAHKYAAPQNIFAGEIGMIDGVRFVETTFLAVIKAVSGAVFRDGVDSGLPAEAVAHASLDVYQSLFLGGNAVGWAEALPVEFRDGGIKDFGRTRELAWYSIMGAGQIQPKNVALLEST